MFWGESTEKSRDLLYGGMSTCVLACFRIRPTEESYFIYIKSYIFFYRYDDIDQY